MRTISFATLAALVACSATTTSHLTDAREPDTGAAADAETATARFADATPTQLFRTIYATTVGDLIFAATLSYSIGPAACPATTTFGSDEVVVGGCTDTSGRAFTGSAQLDNTAALTAGSGIATLTFDAFAESGSASTVTIGREAVDAFELDGTVQINPIDASATSFAATLLGVTVTTTMTTTSCATATCTVGNGATLDIGGLGTAELTGSWSMDQSSGTLVLAGADTLTVALTGSGCRSYAISDGGSGTLCGTIEGSGSGSGSGS
jgi:fibronectin-binding autotransporter adhesin